MDEMKRFFYMCLLLLLALTACSQTPQVATNTPVAALPTPARPVVTATPTAAPRPQLGPLELQDGQAAFVDDRAVAEWALGRTSHYGLFVQKIYSADALREKRTPYVETDALSEKRTPYVENGRPTWKTDAICRKRTLL